MTMVRPALETYFSVENITKGDVFVKACAVAQPAATAAMDKCIVIDDCGAGSRDRSTVQMKGKLPG